MRFLRVRWSDHLRQADLSDVLVSWLCEPGSLTLRGLSYFGNFEVQPLFEGQHFLADHQEVGQYSREVVLLANRLPFIYAYSVLKGDQRGILGFWMKKLGRRPLGSLLFQFPGFRRGRLQFARLDSRHRLFQLCREQLVERQVPMPNGAVWARRCEYRYGRQSVLVTEVFVGLGSDRKDAH